jgi:glycerophosphoryl diester phosphodiesterase
MLKAHDLSSQCIVSSFDPLLLRRFASVAPGVATALIYISTREAPATIRHARGLLVHRPPVLKPDSAEVTPSLLKRNRRHGRLVIPWTVDEPATAIKLAGMGVDGIISNRPEEIQVSLSQA